MPGSDQRIAGLKIGLLGRFRGQRLSRWVRLSRLGCPRDVPNRRDTRRQLQQLWATLLTTERTGLRPQLLQRRDDHHTRRRAKEAKIVPYIFAKTRHESALPQEREKARHVDEPFPRYTHRLGARVARLRCPILRASHTKVGQTLTAHKRAPIRRDPSIDLHFEAAGERLSRGHPEGDKRTVRFKRQFYERKTCFGSDLQLNSITCSPQILLTRQKRRSKVEG